MSDSDPRYETTEEKAKKFDELVKKARMKRYGHRENVGLRLLADAYVDDVRKSRQTDRRG